MNQANKVIDPSSVNTKEERLKTSVRADKNELASDRLACTSRNKNQNDKQYSTLDFNPEFLIQFRTYLHKNNLKRERNNP